jgi:hypothetical protein
MDKFLILEFRNAGLFRKHRNTKDKMFNFGERSERNAALEFIEPITSQHVTNLLHVLFGKRPKPMNRYSIQELDEYLVEKAKQSFLQITTYKNDKDKFYSESIKITKAVHNAWNPVSYMYWKRIEDLLGKELYNNFIGVLYDVFKLTPDDVSFNKMKVMIKNTKDERLDNIFIKLNSKGKKPLWDSIFGKGTEPSNINKNHRTKLTVTSGVDKIIRLDGSILVPVSDDDLDIIRKNKGCATILDGGLVTIKSVKNANFVNTEGYTLVGEISLEKY